MGFLKKLLKFEKKNLKKMVGMVKDNPERLLLGAADPFSSKMWGKVLGKDYDPIVNQWGGPTKESFQEAADAGVDVGPASKLHGAAQTVASIYAGGYGGTQLGNLVGKGGGALKMAAPQLMNAGAGALDNEDHGVAGGYVWDPGTGQYIAPPSGYGRSFNFDIENPYGYGAGSEKTFSSRRGYSDGGAVKDGYDSPDEAARAALRDAVPMSDEHEYAGAVYEKDGRFFFTKPKSSGKTHDVSVRVSYPKGAKLSALYHTHPDGEDSELFSPQDIDAAKQLKVPYYMGHVRDGTMSAFRPGESKVKSARRSKDSAWRGARPSYSSGEALGKLFEELEEAQSADTNTDTEGQVAMGYNQGGVADSEAARDMMSSIGEIASVPGGLEMLATEAAKQDPSGGKKLRLYSIGGGVGFAGGGLAQAAEMTQAGGRGDDEMLVHMSPEEYEAIVAMWGEPDINPDTGLPEYGFLSKLWKGVKKGVKKVVSNPLFSAIAPLALNVFAPGLGSAIGGALGATGKAASIIGNTAVRGGLGALSGGKEGAISGALTGATMSGAGSALGGKLGLEGQAGKLAGDALLGGTTAELAGGDFMTGATGQALDSLVRPGMEKSGEDLIRGVFKPQPGVLASEFNVPSVDDVPLGDTLGVLGGVPEAAPAAGGVRGMIDKGVGYAKRHPYITAGGALALAGLAGRGGSGNDDPAPPQLPDGFNDPLPNLSFDREAMPIDDYYSYGQSGGEQSFFSQNAIPQGGNTGNSALDNPAGGGGPPPGGDSSAQPMQLGSGRGALIGRIKLEQDGWTWDESTNTMYPPGWFVAQGYGPTQQVAAAAGGIVRRYARGGGVRGPRKFSGGGTGRSDDIPAFVSDGEYVMDAETVAMLGDGSVDAGARRLDEMRKNLRRHKGKKLSRGEISPDARRPEEYFADGGEVKSPPKKSKSAMKSLKALSTKLEKAVDSGNKKRVKDIVSQLNRASPGSGDKKVAELSRGGLVGRSEESVGAQQ